MSIVSYAQNFEDVMLWRALKNIEKGFYIDVGANDPELDSVTKLFYDKGWRGINVEPVTESFSRLEESRQRDINLQIALGSEEGEMTLYELPGTGLSTMDREIAERHEKERGYKKIEQKVVVRTLTNICSEYHEKPIHFLKIDVEGAEKDVLEGLDLERIRPWIIVVESTLPNTQIENCEEWEPRLLNARYSFVYFDGLNRFYIAEEHKNLCDYFNTPPNLFDEFKLHQHLNLELRAQAIQDKMNEAGLRLQEAEAKAMAAEQRAQDAEAEVVAAEQRVQGAETKIKGLMAEYDKQLQGKEEAVKWLSNEWEVAKLKIEELHQSSHHWWLEAERLNSDLERVYRSRAWRITWPLRKLMHLLKRLRFYSLKTLHWIVWLVKPPLRWLMVKSIEYVLARPVLKRKLINLLHHHPKIESKLRYMALRGLGRIPAHETPSAQTAPQPVVLEPNVIVNVLDPELSYLTPTARHIYRELKAAIKKNGMER